MTPEPRARRSRTLTLLGVLALILFGLIVADISTGGESSAPIGAPVAVSTTATVATNNLDELSGAATSADVTGAISGPAASPGSDATGSTGGQDWLRIAQIAVALTMGWLVVTAIGWRGMGGR